VRVFARRINGGFDLEVLDVEQGLRHRGLLSGWWCG